MEHETDAGGVDGRRMSRRVLAELNMAYVPVYEAALELQRNNPAVRAAALAQPTDSAQSAESLVLLYAMHLHPQVLRSNIAYCQTVNAELLMPADPVAPEEYNRGVDGDETRGPVEADRLAQLEDENRRLRVEVDHLRGVLRAVRAVADYSANES